MSKKQGLVNLPLRGWLYWDGTMMQDDDTLTVTGKYIDYLSSKLLFFFIYQFLDGEPTYPKILRVSSTGAASERSPCLMGVHKITNMTRSDRPVWQSTVIDDTLLFYNGNNIFFCNQY